MQQDNQNYLTGFGCSKDFFTIFHHQPSYEL